MVKGQCRNGRLKEAGDVFSEMSEAGVKPNNFTFGSYIEGLCSTGDTDSGFQLVKMMKESGSPVDFFAYACVIHGFVRVEVKRMLKTFYMTLSIWELSQMHFVMVR